MSRRIVAAIAGGSLVLGIAFGAAGAVLVREATQPNPGTMATHMATMQAMHESMTDQMGSSMGSGMMGAGMMSSGMGGGMSGADHLQHHSVAP